MIFNASAGIGFSMVILVSSSAVCILGMGSKACSQGCIPAHYVSLSLGAEGISYLQPGQCEAGVSYRFLHAENVFAGTEQQPQLHAVGGRNTVNSFDLSATYALDFRFSLSLTLPFEHDDFSLINDDGRRHSGSSGGLDSQPWWAIMQLRRTTGKPHLWPTREPACWWSMPKPVFSNWLASSMPEKVTEISLS